LIAEAHVHLNHKIREDFLFKKEGAVILLFRRFAKGRKERRKGQQERGKEGKEGKRGRKRET